MLPADVLAVGRIELPQVFDAIHELRHACSYMVITVEPDGTIRHSFGPASRGSDPHTQITLLDLRLIVRPADSDLERSQPLLELSEQPRTCCETSNEPYRLDENALCSVTCSSRVWLPAQTFTGADEALI